MNEQMSTIQNENILISKPYIYSTMPDSTPKKLVKTSKHCHHIDCKKKLLLSDVTCKCMERFCSLHRLPELHACTYDFKEIGKIQLSNALPKVEGSKLERL